MQQAARIALPFALCFVCLFLVAAEKSSLSRPVTHSAVIDTRSGLSGATTSPLALVRRSMRFLRGLAEDNAPTGLELAMVHVDASVTDHFARTTAQLGYTNELSEALQAQIVLWLPQEALVSHFDMRLDDRYFIGEVKEVKQAQQDFEDAADRGDGAGLLEGGASQEGMTAFVFSVSVPAEASAEFTIRWDQMITRAVSQYSYVLSLKPGSVVPDLNVAVDVLESAGLRELACGTIGATATQTALTAGEVRYAPDESQQGSGGLDTEMVVVWDHEALPDGGHIVRGNDGSFAHFFSKDGNGEIPKSIAFVLDVSGSMGSENKIEDMKAAFEDIVSTLSESDEFAVISFSTDVVVWGDGMQAATASAKAAAGDYISGLQAGGGTNIMGGLEEALSAVRGGGSLANGSPRPQLIVLLSDGEPSAGSPSDPAGIRNRFKQLQMQQEPRALVFCIALGLHLDADFLKALAIENGGFSQQIYTTSSVASQLERWYERVRKPVLLSLSFSYSPEPSTAMQTRTTAPFLMEGSEIVVTGQLDGAHVEEPLHCTVTATSVDGDETYQVVAAYEPGLTEHVQRLAVLAKVNELLSDLLVLDCSTCDDERSAAEAEALALALEHQLVVPGLTALVVVEVDSDGEAADSADQDDADADSPEAGIGDADDGSEFRLGAQGSVSGTQRSTAVAWLASFVVGVTAIATMHP